MNNLKNIVSWGVRSGVYPGCVLVVGNSRRILFEMHAGHACINPETVAIRKDTIFDVASLTKPLATVLGVMKLINDGLMDLDQHLKEVLGDGVPEDKRHISIRHLLSHCSGLPEWKPFYEMVGSIDPREAKSKIRNLVLGTPLDYEPGKKAVYSDLGYILLEWVVERISGLTLSELVSRYFYAPLGLTRTFFQLANEEPRFPIEDYAATEKCRWRGTVIRGHVHDENAYVMGGYSGHAGLFSTALDAYYLCACLVQHYYGQRSDMLASRLVREFLERQSDPAGTTWTLGWDTPSPEGSSAGKFFSKNSIGHLGFTGTSVWIDLDRDLIVVFFTNRIHPIRDNEKIRDFRPRLHDAVVTWFEGKND